MHRTFFIKKACCPSFNGGQGAVEGFAQLVLSDSCSSFRIDFETFRHATTHQQTWYLSLTSSSFTLHSITLLQFSVSPSF